MTTGNAITGLEAALQKLKTTGQTLSTKNQQLLENWLNEYSDYLSREATFDPVTETLKYEAGTVLSVELGYNPGSELGGSHYVVVVEDNAKSSDTVMVVPLGSSKPNKSINWNDVDLGEIPEINALSHYPVGTKSVAKVSQMRAISKLRIKAPVRSGDDIVFIPTPKLRDLYNKIKVRFTTKGLNRQTATSPTSTVPSNTPSST